MPLLSRGRFCLLRNFFRSSVFLSPLFASTIVISTLSLRPKTSPAELQNARMRLPGLRILTWQTTLIPERGSATSFRLAPAGLCFPALPRILHSHRAALGCTSLKWLAYFHGGLFGGFLRSPARPLRFSNPLPASLIARFLGLPAAPFVAFSFAFVEAGGVSAKASSAVIALSSLSRSARRFARISFVFFGRLRQLGGFSRSLTVKLPHLASQCF